MIRGVNRKVIEITKCNSDYFDRAFLLVRDDKSLSDPATLKSSAELYLSSLPVQGKRPRRFVKALKALALVALGFLMCLIIMNVT